MQKSRCLYNFACGSGSTGDCSESYVTDVTQCPGYVPPIDDALPTIPDNCTVLIGTNDDCTALFDNGIAWDNCIPDTNGIGEMLQALANEGSTFTVWSGDNLGCIKQTGRCTVHHHQYAMLAPCLIH